MITVPCKITLLGDKEKARDFIGAAQSQMRILENQLNFQRLKQGARRVQLTPGGVITESIVCFNLREVRIYCPPTVVVAGGGYEKLPKLYVYVTISDYVTIWDLLTGEVAEDICDNDGNEIVFPCHKDKLVKWLEGIPKKPTRQVFGMEDNLLDIGNENRTTDETEEVDFGLYLDESECHCYWPSGEDECVPGGVWTNFVRGVRPPDNPWGQHWYTETNRPAADPSDILSWCAVHEMLMAEAMTFSEPRKRPDICCSYLGQRFKTYRYGKGFVLGIVYDPQYLEEYKGSASPSLHPELPDDILIPLNKPIQDVATISVDAVDSNGGISEISLLTGGKGYTIGYERVYDGHNDRSGFGGRIHINGIGDDGVVTAVDMDARGVLAGSGYSVGDILYLHIFSKDTQHTKNLRLIPSCNTATILVEAVLKGQILKISLLTGGNGYEVDSAKTTGGEGTGCKVNIHSIGERGSVTDVSIRLGGINYSVGDILTLLQDKRCVKMSRSLLAMEYSYGYQDYTEAVEQTNWTCYRMPCDWGAHSWESVKLYTVTKKEGLEYLYSYNTPLGNLTLDHIPVRKIKDKFGGLNRYSTFQELIRKFNIDFSGVDPDTGMLKSYLSLINRKDLEELASYITNACPQKETFDIRYQADMLSPDGKKHQECGSREKTLGTKGESSRFAVSWCQNPDWIKKNKYEIQLFFYMDKICYSEKVSYVPGDVGYYRGCYGINKPCPVGRECTMSEEEGTIGERYSSVQAIINLENYKDYPKANLTIEDEPITIERPRRYERIKEYPENNEDICYPFDGTYDIYTLGEAVEELINGHYKDGSDDQLLVYLYERPNMIKKEVRK